MKRITEEQRREIDAEFLALPYVADIFIEDLGIGCFSEIPLDKFTKVLSLARQFRSYSIGISDLKKK